MGTSPMFSSSPMYSGGVNPAIDINFSQRSRKKKESHNASMFLAALSDACMPICVSARLFVAWSLASLLRVDGCGSTLAEVSRTCSVGPWENECGEECGLRHQHPSLRKTVCPLKVALTCTILYIPLQLSAAGDI